MPTGVIGVLLCTLAALAALWWRVIRRRSRGVRLAGTVAVTVAGLLTLAAPVGLLAGSGRLEPDGVRVISAAGLTWLATLFYLLLTAIVVAIVAVAARIVTVFRPGFDGARLRRTVALTGVIGAVAVTGYGLFEAATPRITHTEVRLAGMPAAFGDLRIALVTDLHAGPVRTSGFVRQVVRATNAQRPDLVILGGDLIDGTVEQIGDDLAPLRELTAPLGVLAVTGNHEYYAGDAVNWVQRWREVGVRPLVNESVRLQRGGAAVTVVGANDRKGTAPLQVDYDAAFAGVAREDFTVAVAHEPLQGYEFARRGADLQLAGHTHGGQLWPFGHLVRLQQPTLAGLEQIDGMPVYTSRGAGAWGPPVRVGAPPEIAMLTVRAG